MVAPQTTPAPAATHGRGFAPIATQTRTENMTAETTTAPAAATTAETSEWGATAKLRTARDYLGMTQVELASTLGMSVRSLQRMETSRRAIPASLWDAVMDLHDTLDRGVDALVEATMAELARRGKAEDEDAQLLVEVSKDDTPLDRAIMARAYRQCGAILPVYPTDTRHKTGTGDDPLPK